MGCVKIHLSAMSTPRPRHPAAWPQWASQRPRPGVERSQGFLEKWPLPGLGQEVSVVRWSGNIPWSLQQGSCQSEGAKEDPT